VNGNKGPVRVDPGFAAEYPGVDALAVSCIVNLFRTHDLLDGLMNRWLRQHGLSVGTFAVLVALHDAREPLAPKELSERLLVTRGTVTGLLDTLQKRGIVHRLPHPDDRRMLLVEMTDTGYAIFERLRPIVYLEGEWLSCLDDSEKEVLLALLAKLQLFLRETAVPDNSAQVG
jgi:DNA-binding MarR family transcriptional regulator